MSYGSLFPLGWQSIDLATAAGKTDALLMMIDQAVTEKFAWSEIPMEPREAWIVADDGFDDGCNYDPRLYLFWRDDLTLRSDSVYGTRYIPTGRPFCHERLSSREWDTVRSLATWKEGSMSGVAAVVGRCMIELKKTKDPDLLNGMVQAIYDVTWFNADDYQADRIDEGDA